MKKIIVSALAVVLLVGIAAIPADAAVVTVDANVQTLPFDKDVGSYYCIGYLKVEEDTATATASITLNYRGSGVIYPTSTAKIDGSIQGKDANGKWAYGYFYGEANGIRGESATAYDGATIGSNCTKDVTARCTFTANAEVFTLSYSYSH